MIKFSHEGVHYTFADEKKGRAKQRELGIQPEPKKKPPTGPDDG